MNDHAADARKGTSRRKFLTDVSVLAGALGMPAVYKLRENLISLLEDCDHQP